MESVSAAQDWLNNLKTEGEFFRQGGYVPSALVANIFLDQLGRPEKDFKQRIIVGGSAGKGGVTSLVAQTLLQQGKTVALISSPHLQVITERIRINGKLSSLEDWAEGILKVQSVARELGKNPTFYEANVLGAILIAHKYNVEYLVVEVGMGGDFDATHAISGSRIAAVTFIGSDHREVFKTAENTAYAKGGIFDTPDLVAAFSGEKQYREILQSRSQIPIQWIKGLPSKMNKKIAREICEYILGHSDFVMEKSHSPARWETIPEDIRNKSGIESPVILEGAHSVSRFEYIMPKVKKLSGKKIGILGLKKATDMDVLKKIIPEFDEVIFSSIETDRVSKKLHLAKDLYDHFQFGQYVEDPIEALRVADAMNGKVIVIGSLFLCGMIRDVFYPPEAIQDQQTEYPA